MRVNLGLIAKSTALTFVLGLLAAGCQSGAKQEEVPSEVSEDGAAAPAEVDAAAEGDAAAEAPAEEPKKDKKKTKKVKKGKKAKKEKKKK